MFRTSGTGAGKAIPMSHRFSKLRRDLARKGITTPFPKCPLCGSQVRPLDYSKHTRQCEKDCASLSIEAVRRKLLAIRNTVPRSPEHAILLDLEIACLEQEASQAFNLVAGLDRFGRGRVVTDATAEDQPTELD